MKDINMIETNVDSKHLKIHKNLKEQLTVKSKIIQFLRGTRHGSQHAFHSYNSPLDINVFQEF